MKIKKNKTEFLIIFCLFVFLRCTLLFGRRKKTEFLYYVEKEQKQQHLEESE